MRRLRLLAPAVIAGTAVLALGSCSLLGQPWPGGGSGPSSSASSSAAKPSATTSTELAGNAIEAAPKGSVPIGSMAKSAKAVLGLKILAPGATFDAKRDALVARVGVRNGGERGIEFSTKGRRIGPENSRQEAGFGWKIGGLSTDEENAGYPTLLVVRDLVCADAKLKPKASTTCTLTHPIAPQLAAKTHIRSETSGGTTLQTWKDQKIAK